MRRRRLSLALTLAAASSAAAAPCLAQADARLDAAVAVVKYDGYLSSGAAALSPSLIWQSPNTTLAARGTLLVFESGNTSVQALFSGDTFSPASGPVRVELAGEAGGSGYAGVATFLHGIGHARLHYIQHGWGIWAGGLGGAVVSKVTTSVAAGATGVSTGAWARGEAGALAVSWTRVNVGVQTYDDLQGRAQWRPSALTLEGNAGIRTQSNAVGSSAYADLSAALRLTDRIELVVAAGSYPSDPVRGTIPGRFATAGVRFATRRSSQRPIWSALPALPARLSAAAPGRLAGVGVSVERADGVAYLIVVAPSASSVEVMGDFTDWQPVALPGAGARRYRFALGVVTGVLRFNLRVDGGAWGVPEGVAVDADDFGGSVGVLVVP